MELVGYEDVEARSHEALASLAVHIQLNRVSEPKQDNTKDEEPKPIPETPEEPNDENK